MVNALKTIGWRLMRFRLRTLLIVVSLVAVVFGYWVVPARRQARAVEALVALGVNVRYDFQSDLFRQFVSGSTPSPPPGPALIREYLGIDYLSSVRVVTVPRYERPPAFVVEGTYSVDRPSRTRDADYRHLAELKCLEYLTVDGGPLSDNAMPHIGRARSLFGLALLVDREPPLNDDTLPPQGISDLGLRSLSGLRKLVSLRIYNPANGLRAPAITDDGLASLAGLTNLEELSLVNTKIRGPGLRHLRPLKRLRTFGIESTPLGDVGLAHLTGCEQLKALWLDETRITDDGLKHVASIQGLLSITLRYNKLTDAGMTYLSRLANLSALRLEGNGITNAGLDELARAPAIERLELSEPEITDAGLKHLARFPVLQEVSIGQATGVTDEGVRTLMTSLPSCKVGYQFKANLMDTR
jgi:hypothetical protein